MRTRATPTTRDLLALVRMLTRYGFTIAPVVHRELRAWRRLAAAIPDPGLRAHAVGKLRDERLNTEAAASFAAFVPRPYRAETARLMVAFQVMYDYLDAVSEERLPDRGRNGLQLHQALLAGMGGDDGAPVDFYRHHPAAGDGGYLLALVQACRGALDALPSWPAVGGVAVEAARRCGRAQTLSHVAAEAGPGQLADWAAGQRRDPYEWWEWAAGATASLCVHALFAAAGVPGTTRGDAERIEAAYQPAIGALATLLDSVIDRVSDARELDHSYVAYYADDALAAARIAHIAEIAGVQARALPDGDMHGVVVTGIACFYLSSPTARDALPTADRRRILAAAGPSAGAVMQVLRVRRRLGRERTDGDL